MNLYIIHCGFYDAEISEGIYEFHINIPIVAENLDNVRKRASPKGLPTGHLIVSCVSAVGSRV